LQRGQYTINVLPADLKPIKLDKNTPLDLYEARNAVRIAQWAGADRSANETFQKATKLLEQAEAYKARNAGNKPVSMTARQAVQTSEDARLITLKSQAEARLEQERAASAAREAEANAKTAGRSKGSRRGRCRHRHKLSAPRWMLKRQQNARQPMPEPLRTVRGSMRTLQRNVRRATRPRRQLSASRH
jgi:hypothetical protein